MRQRKSRPKKSRGSSVGQAEVVLVRLREAKILEALDGVRRCVKTQGSLPSEDAALVLLFSLVASGQIQLRRIDGWRKIAAVLSQRTAVTA